MASLSTRLWSNEDRFQTYAFVWQTSQNGRPHYQSCMYPTNSAWPAFLMRFFVVVFLPIWVRLRHGFTGATTKACLLCTTPASTNECSPLDSRRASATIMAWEDFLSLGHWNFAIIWKLCSRDSPKLCTWQEHLNNFHEDASGIVLISWLSNSGMVD